MRRISSGFHQSTIIAWHINRNDAFIALFKCFISCKLLCMSNHKGDLFAIEAQTLCTSTSWSTASASNHLIDSRKALSSWSYPIHNLFLSINDMV